MPRAKVRQDYLKPRDIKRVRTGEFVKTYHVGRAVDGRGGNTLHEAHRVYRLERPSRWSLARNQPPLASTGPVNQIVDSAFQPAPESRAIRAELNRQRTVSEELERSRDELVDTLTQMRSKLTDSADKADVVRSLRSQIEQLQAELAVRPEQAKAADQEAIKPPVNALQKWGDQLEGSKP